MEENAVQEARVMGSTAQDAGPEEPGARDP